MHDINITIRVGPERVTFRASRGRETISEYVIDARNGAAVNGRRLERLSSIHALRRADQHDLVNADLAIAEIIGAVGPLAAALARISEKVAPVPSDPPAPLPLFDDDKSDP